MNPKTALAVQSAGLDYKAIDRASLQPTTKAKYKRELENLASAGINPLDLDALTTYADGLKSSRKSFLKSALRLISEGFEQSAKGRANPENIAQVQASIYRLEAMRGAVKVQAHKGEKAHTWLTQKQVTDITALCSDDLEGQRDWIVLGLLLGAGLRRGGAGHIEIFRPETTARKRQDPDRPGGHRQRRQGARHNRLSLCWPNVSSNGVRRSTHRIRT